MTRPSTMSDAEKVAKVAVAYLKAAKATTYNGKERVGFHSVYTKVDGLNFNEMVRAIGVEPQEAMKLIEAGWDSRPAKGGAIVGLKGTLGTYDSKEARATKAKAALKQMGLA